MKIELPERSNGGLASGSLVPPLGHVQKQWLPLLGLVFLLVMLMGLAHALEAAVVDQKAVAPTPRSMPAHSR